MRVEATEVLEVLFESTLTVPNEGTALLRCQSKLEMPHRELPS